MKIKVVGYWLVTIPFALLMTVSGLSYFAMGEMDVLGYPQYFWYILGTWKVLGAVVVLMPGVALIKEWAYAGFLFTLTGAAASHAFFGDGVETIIPPLVVLTLMVASYLLRPASRRLTDIPLLIPSSQDSAVRLEATS